MNNTFIIATITLIFLVGIGYMGYVNKVHVKFFTNNQKPIMYTTDIKKAYFAGGCFWCVESSFEKREGIIEVISGYAGGTVSNPSYEQVGDGNTKHREAVEVIYDPSKISYNDLLEIFWRTANPTDEFGQYVDRGFQYTSAIFTTNEEEEKLAESSREALQRSGKFAEKIVTPIIPFTNFYQAENYHQDYYKVNPVRYQMYTNGSGRKEFLEKIWGKDLEYKVKTSASNTLKSPSDSPISLKDKLTPIQYEVTQEDGTEKPFNNAYHDNKREGIYVDIVDGTPLFSSKDKYDSGTGWPSFVKPLTSENIVETEDNTLFSTRTEVRSKKADSHLGHVFNDGPKDQGGLRYCLNSASLRFIPKADMEKEGYEKYIKLFQ